MVNKNKALTMKLIPAIVITFGLAGVPPALAQGCCSQAGGQHAGCDMGNMAGHTTSAAHEGHVAAPTAAAPQGSAPRAVFMQPVQSVYDSYIQVQTSLAEDSLEKTSSASTAMVKAIQGDSMKMLPPKVAQQAEALSKAKDLETARAAFKSLSASLIQYLKDQKVPSGVYHEVYCPMAKASWLQTDKTITNPYMGKDMTHCGQFKS
jgi:Cu(I)/Ag(I) efflux system membrane fusion protein